MATAALTEKQTQVYGLMQADTDPKDIASKLKVSKAAIYSHIRAIREAGHPVSTKYANVGVGGRGASTRARAKGKGRGSAAKRAAAARTATAAAAPPERTLGNVSAAAAAGTTINVEDVFTHLREQIAKDSQRIEARRATIATEVETLNERIAKLGEEDSDLEIALARLRGTDKTIDAAPDPATVQGNGGTPAAA